MIWVLYTIGIITTILIILSFTKLTVSISFSHKKDDQQLKVKLSIWGNLIKYTIKVPLVKVAEDGKGIVVQEDQKLGDQSKVAKSKKKITIDEMIKNIKKMQRLLEHVVGFHRIVKKFLRHIQLTTFKWETAFGVGDAAKTGMIAGVVWGMKGNMIGLFHRLVQVKTKPVLVVQPLFTQAYLETRVKCMFSFRIGHAIVAALRLLKHWRKLQKGGKGYVRTSNSRFNDNSYGKLKAHD